MYEWDGDKLLDIRPLIPLARIAVTKRFRYDRMTEEEKRRYIDRLSAEAAEFDS